MEETKGEMKVKGFGVCVCVCVSLQSHTGVRISVLQVSADGLWPRESPVYECAFTPCPSLLFLSFLFITDMQVSLDDCATISNRVRACVCVCVRAAFLCIPPPPSFLTPIHVAPFWGEEASEFQDFHFQGIRMRKQANAEARWRVSVNEDRGNSSIGRIDPC